MVHDPMADPEDARRYYGVDLLPWGEMKDLDALVLAVAHRDYRARSVAEFVSRLVENGCLVDVKSMLDRDEVARSGVSFWRL
jgi:UDP-N-acetyl-D-galactosamine dehydrogenase